MATILTILVREWVATYRCPRQESEHHFAIVSKQWIDLLSVVYHISSSPLSTNTASRSITAPAEAQMPALQEHRWMGTHMLSRRRIMVMQFRHCLLEVYLWTICGRDRRTRDNRVRMLMLGLKRQGKSTNNYGTQLHEVMILECV